MRGNVTRGSQSNLSPLNLPRVQQCCLPFIRSLTARACVCRALANFQLRQPVHSGLTRENVIALFCGLLYLSETHSCSFTPESIFQPTNRFIQNPKVQRITRYMGVCVPLLLLPHAGVLEGLTDLKIHMITPEFQGHGEHAFYFLVALDQVLRCFEVSGW